jgi:pilus assembly protein CpaE
VNEKITALVVTLDEAKIGRVREVFAALPGFDARIETAKFAECVAKLKQSAADVAVVFLDEQPGAGCVILEEIKKTQESIFAFAVSSERSAEIIVKAIRAGADELLSAIPTEEELLKALIRVVERRRTNLDAQKKSNRIITFFSPHGGVGVTTTALNFALELKRLTRDEVVLVDLDLQRGESPVFLNFQAAYNILDVCEGIAGLDPVLLKGSLHSHPSGLQVLAPPTNVEDCEAVQAEHVEKILNLLREMFRWVVVDTSSHLNEVTLVALERANRTYMVCDNMVPTVRACQRILDTLVRLGIDTEDFRVVMGRPSARSEITAKDISEALKAEVVASIPFDESTAVAAANQGLPLREVNARSGVVEAIEELAKKEAGIEERARSSRGLFGKLFSEARP